MERVLSPLDRKYICLPIFLLPFINNALLGYLRSPDNLKFHLTIFPRIVQQSNNRWIWWALWNTSQIYRRYVIIRYLFGAGLDIFQLKKRFKTHKKCQFFTNEILRPAESFFWYLFGTQNLWAVCIKLEKSSSAMIFFRGFLWITVLQFKDSLW